MIQRLEKRTILQTGRSAFDDLTSTWYGIQLFGHAALQRLRWSRRECLARKTLNELDSLVGYEPAFVREELAEKLGGIIAHAVIQQQTFKSYYDEFTRNPFQIYLLSPGDIAYLELDTRPDFVMLPKDLKRFLGIKCVRDIGRSLIGVLRILVEEQGEVPCLGRKKKGANIPKNEPT